MRSSTQSSPKFRKGSKSSCLMVRTWSSTAKMLKRIELSSATFLVFLQLMSGTDGWFSACRPRKLLVIRAIKTTSMSSTWCAMTWSPRCRLLTRKASNVPSHRNFRGAYLPGSNFLAAANSVFMNRNTRARQPPEKPDRNSEELVAENITATPTNVRS